jgi:uroporphyrinogen-III decarboxylase
MPPMPTAEMTFKERFNAAINLQKCDHVPIGLPLSWFAGRYAGLSMAEYATNCQASADAVYKTFQDLGGLDLTSFTLSPALVNKGMPIKQKIPGRELPVDSIIQYHEKEVMTPDEFDIVISKGWRYYYKEYIMPRIQPELCGPSGDIELKNREKEVLQITEKLRSRFVDKSIIFNDSFMVLPPFETLSMARSFGPFLLDLYRRPDKVIAAIDVMLAESIEMVTSQMKSVKKSFGNTAISRSSNTFISPKQFEKFVFPSIKQIVDIFVNANLTVIFHLDQDWLKFLTLFRQFPEGRYIVQLDGATDMFEAKKVVGDRMCLMGDVPARLLKLGTTQSVEQYCRKLIDNVGKGSGFILSCGCDIPVDAKFENVKAMVDTAKNYLPPR